MDVNLFNLYALITAVASVIMLIYLIPKVYTELKRPKDSFTRLRRTLFLQPILALLMISVRVPYFIASLDVPARSTAAGVVSVATSTVLLLFILNMLKSYTYKEK